LKKKLLGSVIIASSVFTIVGCSNQPPEKAESKAFLADEIQQINIQSNVANISVQPTQEEEIKVELWKKEGDDSIHLKANQQDKSLEIKAIGSVKSGIQLDLDLTLPDVKVYLPHKLYEQVTMKTEAGNIYSRSIQAGDVKFATKTGSVKFNEVKSEKIKGVSSAGNMTLQKIIGSFDLQSETGQVNVSLREDPIGENQINVKNGKVQVRMDKNPQSLKVDLDSQINEVKTDFLIHPSSNGTKKKLGYIGEKKEDSPVLKVKSVTGEIYLTKK
jgi:DUF4097 and DUF4098 domain-containing protein YvlB